MAKSSSATCLSSLFFNLPTSALRLCPHEVEILPDEAAAEYLDYSIYLITSSNDDLKFINYSRVKDQSQGEQIPGCRSCLIRPSCHGGVEKPTGTIVLYLDSGSCQHNSSKVVIVEQHPLLQSLFEILRTVENEKIGVKIPETFVNAAHEEIIESFRLNLVDLPEGTVDQLPGTDCQAFCGTHSGQTYAVPLESVSQLTPVHSFRISKDANENFQSIRVAVSQLAKAVSYGAYGVQKSGQCEKRHEWASTFKKSIALTTGVRNFSDHMTAINFELIAYKVALHNFGYVLADALRSLAQGHILATLIPPEVLLQVLDGLQLNTQKEAIARHDLMTYYGFELVESTIVTHNSLNILLNISVHHTNGFYRVYRAVPIRQPIANGSTARQLSTDLLKIICWFRNIIIILRKLPKER